jgi:2-iminobutanoate/2-iminopropanoate deaminase
MPPAWENPSNRSLGLTKETPQDMSNLSNQTATVSYHAQEVHALAKTVVRTDAAPRPGGAYSQAVVVGSLVFTAGVTPVDPATGRVVEGDVEAQTEQTLRNLEAILRAAGSGLEHAVKATVHLADVRRDYAAFNRAYERIMPDPKPARTTVGSELRGVLVEIDLVAEIPSP